jgi:hypothetical protein
MQATPSRTATTNKRHAPPGLDWTVRKSG